MFQDVGIENRTVATLATRKNDLGCSSQSPDPDFSPIPDHGVKKAPGPGSGSATLAPSIRNLKIPDGDTE